MDATSATGSAEREAAAGGGAPAAGALPNLIVIGAQKCGTSGLHFYLDLHPEIAMSDPKEVNFFIAERNWPRGVNWYASLFDPDAPVRGEASPNYTAYPQHEGVPERMAEVVPGARLIYIVRDPIDRIAAHWVHNYSKGRHQGQIAETLLKPRTTYLARSRYAMQLERFLAVYPREQVHVIEQTDLRDRREETVRELFGFAGVDPAFSSRRFASERHKTARKTRPTRLGAWAQARRAKGRSVLSPQVWAAASAYWPLGKRIERPDVRDALPDEVIDELRADAERLRELTGRGFEHWSIWER